jgi:hypothetical protein
LSTLCPLVCNESGSPVGMLSIVVFFCKEPTPCGIVNRLLIDLALLCIWVEDKQPKLLRDRAFHQHTSCLMEMMTIVV